jgi:hypothetical protein
MTRRQRRMLTLYVAVVVGGPLLYLFWQWNSPEDLTWNQLQAALESPDVVTTNDLFAHLSELPISNRTRAYYRDPTELNSSSRTYDKFFAQECQYAATSAPGVHGTPAGVREQLQRNIRWKTPRGKLDHVKRVYLLDSHQATTLQDMLAWGNPVYFTVFVGEDATILGWRRSGP